MPDKDGRLEYVKTLAAVWGAGTVVFDEISRGRPEIQNKLFPIIHECKVQGLALEALQALPLAGKNFFKRGVHNVE